MAKSNKKLKKNVKVDAVGQAHIHASFNNIIISLTNNNGDVISWSSAGKQGFRGSKKNTPYAAQVAAERLAEKMDQFGTDSLKVYIKGVGPGREQGIRGLAKSFDIDLIVDRTTTPHNGCRPKKRRRV